MVLDYGFPLCFSNSLINTGISKPEDYSEEVINEIKNQEKTRLFLEGIEPLSPGSA